MSDEPPPSEENEVAQISVGYVRNLERRLNFIESKNNELQGAVQVLIEKSKKPASGMKIANPEYFKGDRLLLANFLSQCKLKFAGEPSKFPDDRSKIFFAGSYLREGPYSWFQPLLSAADNGGSPAEFVSFHAFSDALTTIYGDPNLVITSEREIRQLRQTTSVAQYIAEFQRLRQYVKHNEAALIDQFYYGLRDNVKDKLVNGPRSETLAEMMKLATSYDARIQERAIERRITPTTLSAPSRSSSFSPGSVPPTPSRTPSPFVRPPPVPTATRPPSAPRAPSTDGTTPMIIDSTRSGPITAAEREHRRINRLCFYCADPGHTVRTCPEKPNPRFSAVPIGSYAPSELSIDYGPGDTPVQPPSTNGSAHE